MQTNPLNCINMGYLQILFHIFSKSCISLQVESIDEMVTLLNIIVVLSRMPIMIVLQKWHNMLTHHSSICLRMDKVEIE